MRNYRVEFHVLDCAYLVAELDEVEAAEDEHIRQMAIDTICAVAPQWKAEELRAFPFVVESMECA